MCFAERNPLEDTEKSLQTLIKLSMNPECIGSLLEGLTNCIQAIMVVSTQSDNTVLEQLVSKLLTQIIQVTANDSQVRKVRKNVYCLDLFSTATHPPKCAVWNGRMLCFCKNFLYEFF